MDRIKELYAEIFDSDGNVRAVGREKCKELIRLLNTQEEKENEKYGNEATGQMDVQKINNLLKAD